MSGWRYGAMDTLAIVLLRARYLEAVGSAETYRDAADDHPALRDFYHALATTYERAARELALMLGTVDKISGLDSEAA